ncbi:DUF4058 family protein [Rhizobium sp. C1]|uniref:DUF4058 family protein n=1 Tax=Rhizobium sp. C1 TaxID=1349799 RepID=UPI001E51C992|nr:DUF4058 family protein [Rhizobium sp. C1]MCD2177709.1 DUF4058 family protein [Rhizobium sp. C1]
MDESETDNRIQMSPRHFYRAAAALEHPNFWGEVHARACDIIARLKPSSTGVSAAFVAGNHLTR